MKSRLFTKMYLLSATQCIAGCVPVADEFLIAANAWREKYQLRAINLPDNVRVAKFITDEHLSDEEISKIYKNSLAVFEFLEHLLYKHIDCTIVDIEINYYVDRTVSITIRANGAFNVTAY